MKHQKSSIPYLLLMAFILIGLPILDFQVQSEHTLKVEVKPIESSTQFVDSDAPNQVIPMLTAVYK